MTLRQKKLLEELPKNNYNISKTAKEVGYSENTSKSSIYNLIRNSKNIKEYFNEHSVKRDIKKIYKMAVKGKDLSNSLRALELESKILGLQKDVSENKTELIFTPIEKEELSYIRGAIMPSLTN